MGRTSRTPLQRAAGPPSTSPVSSAKRPAVLPDEQIDRAWEMAGGDLTSVLLQPDADEGFRKAAYTGHRFACLQLRMTEVPRMLFFSAETPAERDYRKRYGDDDWLMFRADDYGGHSPWLTHRWVCVPKMASCRRGRPRSSRTRFATCPTRRATERPRLVRGRRHRLRRVGRDGPLLAHGPGADVHAHAGPLWRYEQPPRRQAATCSSPPEPRCLGQLRLRVAVGVEAVLPSLPRPARGAGVTDTSTTQDSTSLRPQQRGRPANLFRSLGARRSASPRCPTKVRRF